MTNQLTFSGCATLVRDFIGRIPSSDDEFNELALALFRLQFTHIPPYRRFCESRNVSPHDVRHWTAVPAMPIAGFKELELTSIPSAARTHEFHSSGTTADKRSRHFHNTESLLVYEASLLPPFRKNLLPDDARVQFIILTPSAEFAPNSSLAHMFEIVRREFAVPGSIFVGRAGDDGKWDVNTDATLATLRESIESRHPVALLGTAFNFVQLLDHLQEARLRFQLPPGSRVLETGGYKGRSRIVPKPELHAMISKLLGVPASHIIGEYGMCELSSQAYDGAAGQGPSVDRVFHFPHWARAQVVSVETGKPVADGETGLIRVFDLANVRSVMAVQTEDLGVRHGDGFELLGRAVMVEPRGCSLMSA